MHTISVIIPAFNEEHYIGDCIRSILAAVSPNVVEIIVVDNASTDATSSVAAAFPRVTVVYEPKKGLTAARQRGLEASKGSLLAYIDADSRVPLDWFTQINAAFDSDEHAVCLSGPYEFFDIPDWQQLCVRLYWKVVVVPTYKLTKYMVIGGNFVAKRDALLSINGFDTTIAFYGEDTDIARRLHSCGNMHFNRRFCVQSSGRRLSEQGLIHTGALYIGNFLSEALLHKPVTKKYRDIR